MWKYFHLFVSILKYDLLKLYKYEIHSKLLFIIM